MGRVKVWTELRWFTPRRLCRAEVSLHRLETSAGPLEHSKSIIMASLAGGGMPEPLPTDSRGVIEPPPKEFVCPITQELMEDPVVTSDGHTYERGAVTMWLEQHNSSPLTGEPLAHANFVPNVALRSLIHEYMEQANHL